MDTVKGAIIRMDEFLNHGQSNVMSRIWESQCRDEKEELELLTGLLLWSKEKEDAYGLLFSNIFMARHYLSDNETDKALECLLEARKTVPVSFAAPKLMARMFFYIGLAYSRQGDGQIAAEYYTEALSYADIHENGEIESLILNNLGFLFQSYNSDQEAISYYKLALEKLPKEGSKKRWVQIGGNLIVALLLLNRLEEAEAYMVTCEEISAELGNICMDSQMRNRCCYSAAKGDLEKALEWAGSIQKQIELFRRNRFVAYENFYYIFYSMRQIGNREYTEFFLQEMEEAAKSRGIKKQWTVRKLRMEYNLQYEPEKEGREELKEFYEFTKEYKKAMNKIIGDAMKSRLYFEELLKQQETLKSEKAYLEQQINLDGLTGLYNRRYLEQIMGEWNLDKTGEINKNNKQAGVIMVDIDYFKEYNDYYGHMAGDEAIKTVAACLRDSAAKGITIFRYGGDEFLVLCEGVEEYQVTEYVNAVRRDLYRRSVKHERSKCAGQVTLSIGYYLIEKGKKGYYGIWEAVERADAALYKAKLLGRNINHRFAKGDLALDSE